jgi:hypothetical protein
MDTLDRAPDMPPDPPDVPQPTALEYGPRDVFTVEHRGIYNKLVLYAADETEPREKRNEKRKYAVYKLKTATTKFINMVFSDPVPDVPPDPVSMEIEPVAVQYGPRDVFSVEHRGIYNEWVLYAADTSNPRLQRKDKKSSAALKLKTATTKFFEIEKLMGMDPVQRAETEVKAKADRKAFLNTPIYITEEFVGIGPRDVFSMKGRGKYNAMVANGKDTELSSKKRKSSRCNAATKLKKAVSTFREAERLATMRTEQHANALTVRVYPSYEVFHVECDGELISHGPMDVFTVKQRKVYIDFIACAEDVSIHPDKRKNTRGNAAEMLNIALQKIEKEAVIAALDHMDTDERDSAVKKIHDDDRLSREKNRVSRLKFCDKERNLRLIGDQGALSRQDKKNLVQKDRYRKQVAEERKKSDAKNRAWFKEHGLYTTEFDTDPEIRKEQIDTRTKKIFNNLVGNDCLPENTDRWKHDFGGISFQDLLLLGDYMIYILFTMTDCNPGEEDVCLETRAWTTESSRDPLMRIKCEDGDLKRCTTPQARSIIQTHVLSQFNSAYDATSIEGSCQHYIEEVLQLPHGIVLNRKSGAGSRRENSLTEDEITRIKRGDKIRYTVAVSLIKATDLVFAETDPDEDSYASRGPPLISATVLTHDGSGLDYNVSIQGNSGEFPGTPSVLADRATNKRKKERDNARHRKKTLKRKADKIEIET